MKYLGSVIGLLGTLVLTTSASAAIVCNDEGDCWKTKEKYKYPSGVNVQIYEDDWRWPEGANYRWRDTRPGPGYYKGGAWIGF
jgi:hypothetical protein